MRVPAPGRALVVALVLAPAPVALAAAPIAVPIGWTEDADRRATARVDGWLSGRDDARAVAVLSTSSPDDFAETLAVIELQGALDRKAELEAELARALGSALPLPSDARIDRNVVGNAPSSVRANWVAGDIAYEAVLVPSGPSRTLVVLAVRAEERPLYRATMAAALVGLRGAAPPVEAFSFAPWRWTAIVGWIAATALALTIGLVRRPFGANARTVGRVLAMACLVVAAITTAFAWTSLSDRSDALRLAGVSPTTIAAELVTYGLAAAACCWLVGLFVGRNEGPVASAPRSGAFADRSQSIPRVAVAAMPSAPAEDPLRPQAGEIAAAPIDDAAREPSFPP